MVLEKINPNENLRKSYPKLNAAIDAAEKADGNATIAKTTADQALSNSEQTQKELTQAILTGDSSPLGGQLSVGSDGTIYDGPQERLINEHNKVTTLLAEKVEQTKIGEIANLTTVQKANVVSAINELNAKTKISNIDVFNEDPKIWLEGQIWALRTFALFEETFTGADGSTGYTSKINQYANKITSDAVIGTDERAISGNQLRTLIRPTVNGKFVTRDFITVNSFVLPTVLGEKINIEMKVAYDATVKENQFGLGVVNRNTNPGNGGTWTGAGFESMRVHYSYSTSLAAAYTAIQKQPGGDLIKVNNHSLIQGSQFKVRMQIENTGTNSFTIRWYENEVLKAQADGVNWSILNVFPYFYNQSAHTNAQALFIDDFKVW